MSHYCGFKSEMAERDYNRTNKIRFPQWVRTGIVGNMVKYMENRDYIKEEEDAVKVHYIEVIEKPSQTEVSDGDQTTDITTESWGWRTEDDSRNFRMGEKNSESEGETEEEEYEQEDYYKEVKRFSELTEDEVDIVAGKLRNISPQFANLFRPEIEGGQEEKEYKEMVEEYSARSELIYSVMPQRQEFIDQQNRSMEVDMKVEEGAGNNSIKQIHHSINIPTDEINKSTKKQNNLKKLYHSTDISSNESSRSSEKKKSMKKKLSKHSISPDSSSEEEGDISQEYQSRNTTKRSTKLNSTPVTQTKEKSKPVIQQIEENLPTGWTK